MALELRKLLRFFVLVILGTMSWGCSSETEPLADFEVISISPGNGEIQVGKDRVIEVRFSHPVDGRTVQDTGQIALVSVLEYYTSWVYYHRTVYDTSTPVSIEVRSACLILTPTSPLAPNSTYGVMIRPGIRDLHGRNLSVPVAGTFSTGDTVYWPCGIPFWFRPYPTLTPRDEFSEAGSLHLGRWGHEAALLPCGEVLVSGGSCKEDEVTSTLELFNPVTQRWRMSTSNSGWGMAVSRQHHRIVFLPNSWKILITGGTDGHNVWNSCEIYDPGRDQCFPCASMQSPRMGHTLIETGNGIFAIGGVDGEGKALSSVESYDPTLNQWTLLDSVLTQGTDPSTLEPKERGRAFHVSGLTYAGILSTGGISDDGPVSGSVFLLNDLSVASRSDPLIGRQYHTLSTHIRGTPGCLAYAVGGWTGTAGAGRTLDTAEGFESRALFPGILPLGPDGAWFSVGDRLNIPRHGHTATVFFSRYHFGEIVLIVGGYTSDQLRDPSSLTPTAELFLPNSPYMRLGMTEEFRLILDDNGRVAVLSGLHTGLAEHTATPLLDGSVLIAGGRDYDPVQGKAVPVSRSWVYAPLEVPWLYYTGK